MDLVPGTPSEGIPVTYSTGRARAAAVELRLNSRPSSFGNIADRFTEIALALSFFFVVLYDSHILSLYDLSSLEVSINRTLYAVSIFGIIIGVMRAQILSVILSLALMIYFSFLIYHFLDVSKSEHGGADFGFSPFYARLQLFCIPMIAALVAKGKYLSLKKIIYYIGFAYLSLYIFSSLLFATAVNAEFRAAAFVADYDGRGARIVLDNALASLTFFISLSHLRQRRRVGSLFLFLISCLAIYLSASRYYQFCVVTTTILYWITRDTRKVGVVLGFTFLALAAAVISYILSDQNPFTFIEGDQSLATRAASYEAVRPILREYVLSGVGFSNEPAADMLLVKLNPFYWNDLGLVGVLYVGGIIGVIVFLLMSITCFSSPILLRRAQLSRELYTGLCLAAICTAIYGVVAPTLWYNGLEVFIFILGAMCARRQSSAPESGLLTSGTPTPIDGD